MLINQLSAQHPHRETIMNYFENTTQLENFLQRFLADWRQILAQADDSQPATERLS